MRGARVLPLLVVTALAGAAGYAGYVGYLARPSTTPSGGSAFAALERSPHDVSRWLRLGEEAQQEGDLTLARAAFRAAQEIAPDDGEVHARLGFLLYEEGDDAGALAALRLAREKGADVGLLDFTLSMMRAHVDLAGPFPRFSEGDADENGAGAEAAPPREREPPAEPERRRPAPVLEEREEPGEPEPTGQDRQASPPDEPPEPDDEERPLIAAPGPGGACEIALERRGQQGIFVIDALVNGTAARLIVDTGASLTVLSRDFLADTGLRLDEDGVITARTAGGPQRFATAAVGSVEIGERVAEDIRVAICDECGMPGSDGLLGLDVQEPLGMSLFPGRGTVRFADCWD